MSLGDYLRPFTNAIEHAEQLAHLHSIGHTILSKLDTMEANMATQADIDAFATQLNGFSDDLSTKVKALEDQIAAGVKSEDLDLSGLRDAVSKIGDLDAATTLPASDAPATAPTSDASGEVVTPAPTTDTSAPADAPVAAPAGQDVTPAPVAEQATGDNTAASDAPTGDPTAAEANAPANAIS